MGSKSQQSGNNNQNEVPVVSYENNKRIDELRSVFAARYNKEPEFFVRVPGRVNLIGEHIDYCGFSVCPMAIEQDILVAVGSNSDRELHLTNMENQYEDYTCEISNFKIDVSAGAGGPCWYKYFLCGVQGVSETLLSRNGVSGDPEASLEGMDVAVSGNVPQSAGLSSSSALVSSAVLATSFRNKLPICRTTLADLSAECEKYIGTQGGGMDQAIAFLASEGCAKLIQFNPLRAKDVELPPGAVFVIAHSMAELNKASTGDFNCRVVECRLASQILAKKHGLPWRKLQKLGDLQQALGLSLQSICETVDKDLHPESYSKEEVCRELELSLEELDEVSLTPNTRDIQDFKLHQRAAHVFQEALRVHRFYEVCKASAETVDSCGDAEIDAETDDKVLSSLGDLMTASHESLRDLYECSHPGLDRLVELSKGLAYGMRLTGAGWGGCAVALVPQGKVDEFIATLKEKFYRNVAEVNQESDQIDRFVFATAPKVGATVILSP